MTSHIEQQASNVQGHPKLPDQILGGMSDLVIPSDGSDVIHLPECLYDWPDLPVCICDELRACEQRVRDEERALIAVERTTLAELNVEWHKGVQSARDAVAGLPPSTLPERWGVRTAMNFRGDVLAAIDALREEKK